MLDINHNQLLGLHRYIMETKFSSSASDIAFSPLLAEISNKVLDAIIEHCKNNNHKEYENWVAWRLLSDKKFEWPFLQERIRNNEHWKCLDENQKITHLRILSSPYIVTEEIFLEFVRGIDS
jgi:hypothetical protein